MMHLESALKTNEMELRRAKALLKKESDPGKQMDLKLQIEAIENGMELLKGAKKSSR